MGRSYRPLPMRRQTERLFRLWGPWKRAGTVALGACMAAVALAPGAAFASSAGTDNPSGTVTVGAGDGGSAGGAASGPVGTGGSGSGGGSTVCTSVSLVLNDEGGIAPGGPTPGGWYSVTCTDLATGQSVTQTVWIADQPAPVAPTVSPYSVALQAERSIQLPRPSLHLNPSAAAVVNLPTWLWIDAALWRPYSVSASVGAVTATAVARPVSVTWSPGDGSAVTCPGPGTPFDSELPAAGQSTDCSHTYETSSAGQPSSDGLPDDASFPVRATVTWAVTWSTVGGAGGGTLPALVTTASTSLRVEQVESVNSGLTSLETQSELTDAPA